MAESIRCLIRGSINVDETFQVKEIARPGETISSHGIVKRVGGKGANQSVAVAKAGATVDLIGAIGDDAPWVKNYLKENGVNVKDVEVVKEPTGRALIQVADHGENCIILFKGANFASLPIKLIHPKTSHLLLQNEIPLSDTLAYIDAVRAAVSGHVTTTFNPSPMPSDEELRSFPWDKLDWLIVNETEAEDMFKVLARSSLRGQDVDLKDKAVHEEDLPYKSLPAFPVVLRLLSQIPTTNIICTLGAEGVLALIPSLKGSNEEFSKPIYLPAAKLQTGAPVDTTGAGDCFAGYLVAGLMKLEQDRGTKELTMEDATAVLKRCVQAAGMCVEKPGANESIPLGKDVDARLAGM